MNGEHTHILAKTGVLVSFSISKKMTEKEVNAITKNAMKKGKSEGEIVNMVKEKIMKEILDASHKGKLPGIILESSDSELISQKSVEFLNHMVVFLSKKLKMKKFNKFSLCYFINYLVGILGLSEEDFEEFHRRISEAKNGENDAEQ